MCECINFINTCGYQFSRGINFDKLYAIIIGPVNVPHYGEIICNKGKLLMLHATITVIYRFAKYVRIHHNVIINKSNNLCPQQFKKNTC